MRRKEDGRGDERKKKNCEERGYGRALVNDFRPREKGDDTREIGILIARVIVDEIIVERRKRQHGEIRRDRLFNIPGDLAINDE